MDSRMNEQEFKEQLAPIFDKANAAAAQKSTSDEQVAAFAVVLREHELQVDEDTIRQQLSQ